MKKLDVVNLSRAGAVALLVLAGGSAAAATGSWINDGKARVRLIAEGVNPSGQLRAGIEIELDEGWHTYWRSPGESGIAPAIDFSGSRNLGPVDIAFPPPERLDDGFSVTN